MARRWPLLLLLAAAVGVAAYVALGAGEGARPITGDVDREREAYEAPELRGADAPGGAPRDPRIPRQPTPALPEPVAPTRPEDEIVLTGRVFAAEDDAPLEGARVWLEAHATPCPRLPEAAGRPLELQLDAVWTAVATDAEGRYDIPRRLWPNAGEGVAEVFAWANGRVTGIACGVPPSEETDFHLEPGLALEGRVLDTLGRPVAGARVRVRPGAETPAVPGHGSTVGPATTDEEGRFVEDGLLPGAVMLDVEQARFMPLEAGPFDPADGRDVDLVLVPALLATFRIHTDDGRVPEHPTLIWRTTGSPSRSEVLLLPVQESSSAVREDAGGRMTEEFAEVLAGPVRLPTDTRSVVLEVKADGYAPWRSDALRMPSEGGEEEFPVDLYGDLTTGSIRVALEDDRGEPVHFAGASVEVGIARLDPGTHRSAYVIEQGEALVVTALPAGSYRLLFRSAAFAPLERDVTVEPGEATEVLLRTRPPAKLRVRFFAPRPATVLFRLTQGGRVALGVPEGGLSRGTDPETGEPVLAAGSEGLLLSGLAAGTYVIEVLSEELAAPPTTVRLVEGDTEDVEIHVDFR